MFERTSFPRLQGSVAQLKQTARVQFCGLPAPEAEAIVVQLERLNSGSESIREVFAGLPEFRITNIRPGKGDYLGISKVLVSKDQRTAYFNLDTGGVSGSIVVMKLENGEWGKLEECAQWTSY